MGGKQRRENRTSERRLNDESLERREEGRSEASSTGLLATLSPPQRLPITGDGHGALGELMRDGPPTYRHTAQQLSKHRATSQRDTSESTTDE